MPTNTIKDLGQFGYLPDVAENIIPANGFSYSRNFRFDEANFARVSRGYQSVFSVDISSGINNLGDTTGFITNHMPNATFLHNLIMNEVNTSLYFDADTSTLRIVDVAVDPSTNQSEVRDRAVSLASHVTGTDFSWQAITFNDITILNNGLEAPWQLVENPSGAIVSSFTNATNGVITLSAAIARAIPANTQITLMGSTNSMFNRTFTVMSHTANTAVITVNENTTSFGAFAGTGVEADIAPNIQTLQNWPSGAVSKYLASFNNAIVAIGYRNPSATAVGDRGGNRTIVVSDQQDPDGDLIPPFNFNDPTATTTTSTIIPLSGRTAGELVSAFEQNNNLFINSTTNVLELSFTGEDYSTTVAPFPNGVLDTRSSCPIPNGFFNIGNRRMYIHDGTSATPVGEGRFVFSWFESIDQERLSEVQCIYDPRTTSVWIKTPTGENTQEMWIYNLSNNTLSVQDDHNDIKYMLFSPDGVPAEAVGLTWDNIDTNVEWDTLSENTWEEFFGDRTGVFRNRLLSSGGNQLFVHDSGNTYNGRAINAVLRQEYWQPSNTSSYNSFRINEVIPWVDYEGSISNPTLDIRIGGSNNLNNPIAYTNYKTYNLATSRKIDFRRTYSWGAIEFRTNVSNMIFSGYQIEMTTTDRR